MESRTTGHPKVTIPVEFADWNNSRWAPVEAIADAGAQSIVWGLKAGVLVKNLKPSTSKIRAANSSQMTIVGQFIGSFKGRAPTGDEIICHKLVYFLNQLKGFIFLVKLWLICAL